MGTWLDIESGGLCTVPAHGLVAGCQCGAPRDKGMRTTRISRALAAILASALALAALPARAQPLTTITPPPLPSAPSPADARPWAAGVPIREQEIAQELYIAGNREFTESRFAQALAEYREAIQHWDHPAIRFNIAVCLIHLDQPVEARYSLERSLAFGAPGVGADAYTQGLTYRKLLDAQLGHVKIVCREPGTEITLDGKPLFVAPGAADQYLQPGKHQVVAIKPGFRTISSTLVLVGGDRVTREIEPIPEAPRLTRVRHWDAWRPWAIAGGGAATAGIGAVFYLLASNSFAAYDRGVVLHCSQGCDAVALAQWPEIPRARDRAGVEQMVAFSLLSVGGALLIAGTIGVVMNEPRMIVQPRSPVPAIMPLPGGAVSTMTWRF